MSKPLFRLTSRLAAALALTAAVALRAQDQPKQFNEATSQAFQKLKPLQDAKNWDGMIALLDSIPGVGPTSYDRAMILDMKAKLYLQKEQYAKAIEPWEEALRLSDTYKYFDPRTTLDVVYFLAQLWAQEGQNSKVPAQQQAGFDKALAYYKRWLAETKKPTPEAMVTYASILYYKATADPNKVDQKLLKEARTEIEKGLVSALKPKESFYALLLSILQQQNDLVGSAEYLELILKQTPAKAQFWPVLMATYLNIANDLEKKDPATSRSYLVRAIVTIERAQALGFMKTSKDNMNLVSLYLTAGQFSTATDFLYRGMKSGAIESEPKNWLILGYYYQQANQELTAINVLKEAATLFPNNGQIEMTIGEIYRQMEQTKDAYKHYKEAIRKGNLEKPYLVYQLLAYAAFELEDFDQALAAADKAAAYPESAKDTQLPRLRDAIKGAIQEREYNREQAAKKAKSL